MFWNQGLKENEESVSEVMQVQVLFCPSLLMSVCVFVAWLGSGANDEKL